MSEFHLDTHVVVWLYTDAQRSIPTRVMDLITGADLAISPMVLLELGYLHELGRLPARPNAVLGALTNLLGLRVDTTSFHEVADVAIGVTWTRDPFDRLIVAQALAAGVQLVTADRLILEHCTSATWAEPDAS